MESKEIVQDVEIDKHLKELGFTDCVDEGRLMLAELLLKAGAGYYNSHTEEHFLMRFDLLKIDRTPNKKGRKYLCSMFYTHSNGRPESFCLMEKHRTGRAK